MKSSPALPHAYTTSTLKRRITEQDISILQLQTYTQIHKLMYFLLLCLKGKRMEQIISLSGKVASYIFRLAACYFLAVSEYYINHLRVSFSFFSFHASKTFIFYWLTK